MRGKSFPAINSSRSTVEKEIWKSFLANLCARMININLSFAILNVELHGVGGLKYIFHVEKFGASNNLRNTFRYRTW